MLATSVSLFVSVSALALHHRAEGFAAPHAAVSPRRRGGGRIPVVTPDLDRHGDGGSSVAFVTYGFALQASAGGGGGDDFASFASNLDPPPTSRSSRGSTAAAAGWKDDLDELLGLSASPVRRQVLLQKLLNSNQEIRDAVESALREGKVRRMHGKFHRVSLPPSAFYFHRSLGFLRLTIRSQLFTTSFALQIDPLLTPTGKKWQDGTRAVARQVTTDILPQLTRSAAANANEDSCLGTVTWSNTFDWPSFCGCPDFKTQYICGDFCWDFKVAYAPLPSDIATNANCQDFAGYYHYLLDETQCGGDDLKVACCVNVEGSAAASKMNLRSGLLFQIVFVLARMVGALFLG